MSSPVSQETLQQLRDTAEETAKQFRFSYSLNAAWTYCEIAREAAQAKKDIDNLKLTYREAVGLIKKTMQGVLNVAWAEIQKGAQMVLDKIEPVLRKGLTPITTVHNKILDGIKSVTNKTLGHLMSKHVTPLIEPLIWAYAKPMTEGFSSARETYRIAVTSEDLPKDANKLSKSLGPAKKLNNGVVKIINCNNNEDEDDEDAEELRSDAEESLLKGEVASCLPCWLDLCGSFSAREESRYVCVFPVADWAFLNENITDWVSILLHRRLATIKGLDATFYTLQLRVENGEKLNDALKEKILTQGFDRDTIQLKREVAKKGIRQFILKYFKKAIDADGQISEAIGSVDALIPSEMKDFLNLQSIFDAFIEITVGEPIDRMVEEAKNLKWNEAEEKAQKNMKRFSLMSKSKRRINYKFHHMSMQPCGLHGCILHRPYSVITLSPVALEYVIGMFG